MLNNSIHQRKEEHIDIVLNEKVTSTLRTTGFENVQFLHNALPNCNFEHISLETNFFKQQVQTPFLISSMTGGTSSAASINENLAIAAENRGWTLALGSTRAILEGSAYQETFQLRKFAPTIPIIANLGAVQLNYGYTATECAKIIELTDAKALVLHLNSIQEVIQPNGDTNFNGLLQKIEALCNELDVPLGVKEVGWGIDGTVARQLVDVGVQFIDVAGAGGTSWSAVEKYRTTDPIKKMAAEAFTDWGISTVDCLRSMEELSTVKIASGGIKNGVEAAKSIALGASFVGYGRAVLEAATISPEAVLQWMETREMELRIAMFGIGVQTITQLQETTRIIIEK